MELVNDPPTGIVSPDEVVPRGSTWAPRRWYSGWTKSVLPATRFDAKSTELALADLFEADPAVTWRLRVESHQDVWIPWGHRQRHYPDFIIITEDGRHWIVEGKADDRSNDPDTWHHLFATETAILQAGGAWEGPRNFADWE